MRALLIVVLSLLWSETGFAQEKPTFLICDGFNAQYNGEMRHNVKLYKDRAVFDDENYYLTRDDITYKLIGPLSEKPTSADLLTAKWQIVINRLDGSYVQSKNGNVGSAFDWSRPNDKGCVVSKRKF